MTYQLTVVYGHPTDPAAFDEHCEDVPTVATGGATLLTGEVTTYV